MKRALRVSTRCVLKCPGVASRTGPLTYVFQLFSVLRLTSVLTLVTNALARRGSQDTIARRLSYRRAGGISFQITEKRPVIWGMEAVTSSSGAMTMIGTQAIVRQ